MSYTQWVSNGTNVAYEPKEKDTGEVITPFTTTAPGGVPNSSYAPSTYVLAASGAWIPQTVGTSVSEIRRPTVYTELTGLPSPYFVATDTSLVYDSDTSHITTYGRFELQGLTAQNDASFKFSSFQTKAQTWTSATLNISRNYASTQWTSGTEARYYLSTDGGTNWTLLLTDDYDNDPVTVTIFSHTLATANPSSLSNYQVKVEIDAFSSGALGSVGVLDLQLYDIWIEGIYTVSGGSGDVVGPASATDNAVTRFDSTTGKLIQNSTVTLDDNGNFGNVNSVVLDTTPATLPTSAGTMYWEDGEGTPEVILKGGNTTLKVGTQEYARVYNDSGSTITKGQVVYISGAQGNRIAVKLAQADVEANSYGTLGLVAETIANGAEGWVIVSGALYKLNTLGLTAGATVYLSTTTAGAYTTTKPQAPDQLVVLGFVERVSSTVGSIYVKVDNGYELDELHDVRITSPISGNTLIYDATTSPTGVWKNASLTAGTGVSVTNGAGSITIGLGTVPVANGGTGSTTLTSGSYVVGNGTSAVTLKTPTQVTADLDTFTYQIGATAGKKGLVPAAPAIGASVVYLDQTGSWTTPSGSGTTTNALTIQSPLTGTSFNGSTAVTIGLGTVAVGNGGTGLTSLTAGYIPYGSGTSAFGSSANLFWDSTNSRLGLGITTPSATLHLQGSSPYIWIYNDDETDSGIKFGDTQNTGERFQVVYDSAFAALKFVHVNDTASTLAERMRITSSGQLVLGNGDAVASPTGGTFRATDGSGTDIAGASLTIQGGRGTGTGTGGSIIFNTAPAAGTTGSSLNSPSERMRINQFGSVGIGTASPGAKLHVAAGRIFLDQDWQLTWQNAGTNRARMYGDSGNNIVFENGSGNTERMRITSAGNLGLGTVSPSAKLHIDGSFLRIDQGGANIGYFGDSAALITAAPAGNALRFDNTALRFAYASTQIAMFDTNGNFGVGATPTERLTVTSTGTSVAKFTSSNTATALILDNTHANAWGSNIVIRTGGTTAGNFGTIGSIIGNTDQDIAAYAQAGNGFRVYTNGNNERMRITSAGNVGIGTVSPRAKLETSGSIFATSRSIPTGGAGPEIWWSGTVSGISSYDRTNSAYKPLLLEAEYSYFTTANGSEQMRINNTGVGIGTSSPSAKLTLIQSVGNCLRLASNETLNTFKYSVIKNIPYNNNSLGVQMIGAKSDSSYSEVCVGGGVDGGYAATSLRFYTAANTTTADGTLRLEIDSSGNVKASGLLFGNNGTKGYGAITTTTSTSTPTGGSSGDHYYIY
jgi:hypothetical protein